MRPVPPRGTQSTGQGSRRGSEGLFIKTSSYPCSLRAHYWPIHCSAMMHRSGENSAASTSISETGQDSAPSDRTHAEACILYLTHTSSAGCPTPRRRRASTIFNPTEVGAQPTTPQSNKKRPRAGQAKVQPGPADLQLLIVARKPIISKQMSRCCFPSRISTRA